MQIGDNSRPNHWLAPACSGKLSHMKLSKIHAVTVLSVALLAAAPQSPMRIKAAGVDLIIPADSPVRLRAISKTDISARFSGRFVLSGRYTYGCTDECHKPFAQKDMTLVLSPDAGTVARLPRWEGFRRPHAIEILNASKFAEGAISPRTMHALKYGKALRVSGYTSIVVDDFFTSVECDDSYASARFQASTYTPSVLACPYLSCAWACCLRAFPRSRMGVLVFVTWPLSLVWMCTLCGQCVSDLL